MALLEDKKEKNLLKMKNEYCQEQERIKAIKQSCQDFVKTLPARNHDHELDNFFILKKQL